MNKKYIYTTVIVAVIGLGAVIALYNPWTSLGVTMDSAHVSHIGLHLAEGSQTIFIAVFSVDNPSRVPVTITVDEVTFLINGTGYPSTVMGGDPVVVEPGSTRQIERLVQLTGSPVGYQEEGVVNYQLVSSWVLEGVARSIGFEASQSVTFEDTRNWLYQILS